MNKPKRKICFVITSFIHYARSFLLLEELSKRKDVDLHIVVGGTASLSKYSSQHAQVPILLKKDGLKNVHEIQFNMEGDSTVNKAKTVGLGMIEFASFFDRLKPDLVVVRGDRFEVLSAVASASHMNIPIAHIEGGDVSGTLDESIRHAITKLSHIHFPTNEISKKRIEKMGERKDCIFNFGSSEIEIIKKITSQKGNAFDLDQVGSGASIDSNEDFIMIIFHPVNTEIEKLKINTEVLLSATHELDMPVLWFWPNFDAGAEEISHQLRIFKDEISNHKIRFSRYLPPRTFLSLLNKSKCLIGNSSAGIKECSYLGIPVVNIGSRQNNRLQAGNVLNVSCDKKNIQKAVKKQLRGGRHDSSSLYSVNKTSKKIAETLAKVDLYTQKRFID